jgi:hypothetical protein
MLTTFNIRKNVTNDCVHACACAHVCVCVWFFIVLMLFCYYDCSLTCTMRNQSNGKLKEIRHQTRICVDSNGVMRLIKTC